MRTASWTRSSSSTAKNDLMRTVREGAATLKVGNGVFYNPRMSKLRDISVIFLKASGLRKARLLDTTAATGVRGIRYKLESRVGEVTMLDINDSAYRNARSNARLNRISARVMGKSLQEFAGSAHEAFDIIDIDPFGSPAPMVHDALKVSHNGTLLMVTATDTATLCGAEASACLRIYGSKPIHNELCHESSVRILLSFIAREAAQFNFGIVPLLSIADMHYVRVFLSLERGAKAAAESADTSGFLSYCDRCHNFSFKKGIAAIAGTKCGNCKAKMRVYGPMWLGDTRDKALVSKMLKISGSYPRESRGLLETINGELDIPFFYSIPKMTSRLGLGSISPDLVAKALGKTHSVSRTHFEKDSLKTTASVSLVAGAVKRLGGKK